MRRLPHMLLAVAAVALTPAAAQADEQLATTPQSTPVQAADGLVAWLDAGRLVLRSGDAAPTRTSHRPADGFDVGIDRSGDGTVVWRAGRTVRALTPGRPVRTLATLPRGATAPALWGTKLAYAQQAGSCAVPMVRDLRTGRVKRLDRGRCSAIAQVDVNRTYVATLNLIDRTTEARAIRVGGGPSRRLQRESQGEESNLIGGIALDGDALVTSLAGFRQANRLVRFDVPTGRRTDARAFLDLDGGVARTLGRTYYVASSSTYGDDGCGTVCRVVEVREDPWGAGSRLLPPQLTLTAPREVFADEDATFTGALFRKRVSRTAELGREPVRGVAVTLTDDGRSTGRTGTTDPSGRWSATIPAAALPTVLEPGATSDVGSTPQTDGSYLPVFARITMTAEREADGRVRFRGTLPAPQPGRKVRIDRRDDALCARMRPPVAPADCQAFTQDPVTTGVLSADGSSFEVTAPAGTAAGAFRASLDFRRDDPQARQGRSTLEPVS